MLWGYFPSEQTETLVSVKGKMDGAKNKTILGEKSFRGCRRPESESEIQLQPILNLQPWKALCDVLK